MGVVTITTDLDGAGTYRVVGKIEYLEKIITTPWNRLIGWDTPSAKKLRYFARFSPLTGLPAGAVPTQVRLGINIVRAGAPDHLADIHAYHTNGQTDPCADGALQVFPRCASGNLYLDDSTWFRTVGWKWFVLGGTVCQDLQAAKIAVNRFSLGIHEEGDNAEVAGVEEYNSPHPAQLEITYPIPWTPHAAI